MLYRELRVSYSWCDYRSREPCTPVICRREVVRQCVENSPERLGSVVNDSVNSHGSFSAPTSVKICTPSSWNLSGSAASEELSNLNCSCLASIVFRIDCISGNVLAVSKTDENDNQFAPPSVEYSTITVTSKTGDTYSIWTSFTWIFFKYVSVEIIPVSISNCSITGLPSVFMSDVCAGSSRVT